MVAVQRTEDGAERLAAVDLESGYVRAFPDRICPDASGRWEITILGLADRARIAGTCGGPDAGSGARPVAFSWNAASDRVSVADDVTGVAGPNDRGHLLVVHDPDGPLASAGGEYVGIWDPVSGENWALADLGAPSLMPGSWFWLFDGDLVVARVSPGVPLRRWTPDDEVVEITEPFGEIHRLQAIDDSRLLGCADAPTACGILDLDTLAWQQTDPALGTAMVAGTSRTAVVPTSAGPQTDDRLPVTIERWDLWGTPTRTDTWEIDGTRVVSIVDVDARGRVVGMLQSSDAHPLAPPDVPFLYDPAAATWVDLSETLEAPLAGWIVVDETLTTGTGTGVAGLTFSPDGALLAVTTFPGVTAVWDVAARTRRFEVRSGSWDAPRFAPDGRWLATVAEDGAVSIWSTTYGAVVLELDGTPGSTGGGALDISADGRLLVTARFGEAAEVWDVGRGALVHTLDSPGGVRSARFDRAGTRIATGRAVVDVHDAADLGDDEVGDLWDARTGAHLLSFVGAGQSMWELQFVDDDRLLLSSSEEGLIQWDTGTGEQTVALSTGYGLAEWLLAPDGGRLVTAATFVEPVTAWDSVTFDRVAVVRDATSPLQLLAVSGNGQLIAACRRPMMPEVGAPRIELRDAATLALWRRGHTDTAAVVAAAFHPTAPLLATGNADGSVQLWTW